jgi:hypothetical protein
LDSHPKFGDPAGSETGQAAAHFTVSHRELRKNAVTRPSSAANSRFEDNNPSWSPDERKKHGVFLDRRTQQEQMDRYRGASG